jgi:hypothetical protein
MPDLDESDLKRLHERLVVANDATVSPIVADQNNSLSQTRKTFSAAM